jgi:DNA-directed RNA polymerase alpha subunit
MREPVIHQNETEGVLKPEPTASGAGRRGPPTRIGAMFGDDKSGGWRALPIEELSLSKRAYNVLRRSGLVTIGQVVEKSEEELLALRNFGQRSYDELRDKLDGMGILPAPPPRLPEPL